MTPKTKMKAVIERLYEAYPDAECSLNAGKDPFRMLVMAILSAQCTDKRVNEVSAALFARFPDAKAMAESSESEIEPYIKSCGLYHAKAKNLFLTAKRLSETYGGEVPSGMEDLLSLAGVGRKVANLIRGDVFGLGGIVADTHCIRISGRLGFSDGKDPVKTEKALAPLVPVELQSGYCHRMVDHGRAVCDARNPGCDACVLRAYCDYAKQREKTERKHTK